MVGSERIDVSRLTCYYFLDARRRMTWAEFVATLSEKNHRLLLVSLGAGVHDARHAPEAVTNGGDVEDERVRPVGAGVVRAGAGDSGAGRANLVRDRVGQRSKAAE
jgi:hypothetical protein